jgi:hypothetical protein
MDIQRTGTLDSMSKVQRNTTRREAIAPALNEQDFSQTDALRGALDNLPSSRPEKVRYARDLATNVEYPPAKTIRQLSQLLAVKIQGPNDPMAL